MVWDEDEDEECKKPRAKEVYHMSYDANEKVSPRLPTVWAYEGSMTSSSSMQSFSSCPSERTHLLLIGWKSVAAGAAENTINSPAPPGPYPPTQWHGM